MAVGLKAVRLRGGALADMGSIWQVGCCLQNDFMNIASAGRFAQTASHMIFNIAISKSVA